MLNKLRRLKMVMLLAVIVANPFAAMAQQQKLNANNMKKILIIGMNPRNIDYANPELPPGLTAEKIEQGTEATLVQLKSLGYDAELFLVEHAQGEPNGLAEQLKERRYDGVVIGNGIRGIAAHFILFEKLVNVVHEHAPESRIIFNNLPTDTAEAVGRWLK